MKKLGITILMLLALLLCGCGNDTVAQVPAETAPVREELSMENAEAVQSAEATEAAVKAEDLFAVESINYEMYRDGLKNFNLKIRNITGEAMESLYFRIQALDAAGDVLEAWNMGSSDRLDAGQAYWFYCSGNIFDDCKSLEEAAEKAESIRVLSANIQTIKDDASSWVEYDFEEPPTYKVMDIPEKGKEAAAKEADEAEAPELAAQHPMWSSENALSNGEVEIFDWRETVLENGNVRYEVEYQATAGLQVEAFDPPNGDLYTVIKEQLTSGEREVFTFEMEQSILDQIDFVTVGFWSEEAGNFWTGIEKNWYNASVTEGEPVGEAKTIKVTADSKVKVYSLQAQELDNGFVRFTMEYKTSKGRGVSFFNPPDNDHFIYLMDNVATGGTDTYVIDVPKADVEAVSTITMKFYDLNKGDHVYAEFKAPRF